MLDRITLSFDGRDLQMLYQALDELPGRMGRPLFTRIQVDVQRQIDAQAKAESDAAEKAAGELRQKHRDELLEEQRKASEPAAPAAKANGNAQISGHDPYPTVTLPTEPPPEAPTQ